MKAGYSYDVALLLSSSYRLKFCENLPRKIISITPFNKKSHSEYTTIWNYCKFSKKR